MNLTISICNRWKGTDLVTKSSRCFLFQEFTQIEACAAMAVEKEAAEAGGSFLYGIPTLVQLVCW